MRPQIFDWEQIVRDSAKIMALAISENEKITTLPELYEKLSKKYNSEDKHVPTKNTYRQYMHKMLKIPKGQRSVKNELYRLAGRYEDLTLDELSKNLSIIKKTTDSDNEWLFVKLNSEDNDYSKTQKHLYYLSRELKNEFSEEIVFVSFDTDTLVVLCSDRNARSKISSYFKEED